MNALNLTSNELKALRKAIGAKKGSIKRISKETGMDRNTIGKCLNGVPEYYNEQIIIKALNIKEEIDQNAKLIRERYNKLVKKTA